MTLKNKQSKVIKHDRSEQIYGMLFAAIPLVGFILFGIIPLVLSLVMSFSNVPTFNFSEIQVYTFDELFTNYKAIFEDEKFYKSIVNTLYVIISLPLSMIIGLILAVLLQQKIKGSKMFRTIFFIPYVCSIVAVTLMWRTMLDKNYGIINQFLGWFGIDAIAWLTDPKYFMTAMIIMITWCSVGFNLILYSAALTGISPGLYEAAEMDGAGAVRKFFKITLPLLSPTTFYLLIIGLIGSLQEFARFQAINAVNSNLISPTGPNDSGLTIVFYLYNKAFGEAGTLGNAAAVSWVLTIVTILLTAINFIGSKKWVYSNEKKSR